MTDDIEEDAWLAERRDQVAAYLKSERLEHGPIALYPSWFVAPYVSLWEVESLKSSGRTGWWAICGDHPTDYISANDIDEPREVLRAIGERWLEVSSFMRRGIPHPTVTIGSRASAKDLGELLRTRAELLIKWADDDTVWEDAS